jgi:ubiquinone/menaquinone biosynthesis C-methylase UbiE
MSTIESRYDIHDPDVVSAIDDVPLWSALFGMKLLEVVKFRKHVRVLDIGSGTGFPVVELSQRLGETCRVYGIDPWTEAVERARAKIRTWGLTNVEILEGHAESLPFPDGHFGLIVSNNGTNNVDDEERTFGEIARVAEPGAQIVLTMNLPETMVEFYDTYRSVLGARGMNAEIEKLDAHIHAKRKPLEHTRALLERGGLEIVAVHEDAFTFRYADGTTMLHHFTIQLAFLASWVGILRPEEVSPVMAAVEGELNALAEREGEIRLTIPWVCVDALRLG